MLQMTAALSPEALYAAFSAFPKPAHSTDFNCCPECAEYDVLLRGVEREYLSIEQIGTVCWGPIAFLTPDAMAYFLPRLMELALAGVPNKHLEPFYLQFLNQIGLRDSSDSQFSRLELRHKKLVFQCLEQMGSTYRKELHEACCEDWLRDALTNWSV